MPKQGQSSELALRKQEYQLQIQQAKNVGQLLDVIGSAVQIYSTVRAGIEYRKNLKAFMDTIERAQEIRHRDVDKILDVMNSAGDQLPQAIRDAAYLKILDLLSPDQVTLPSPP